MAELKNLGDKTTPEGKGFRTFFQTALATGAAFLYGLWNLPGVSDYTTNFIRTEGASLLLLLVATIGVPAGLIAFWMNRKGK
jgi:hypothetical protein